MALQRVCQSQAKTVRHEGHKKGVVLLVPDWFTTVYLSVPNGSVLGVLESCCLTDPRVETPWR